MASPRFDRDAHLYSSSPTSERHDFARSALSASPAALVAPPPLHSHPMSATLPPHGVPEIVEDEADLIDAADAAAALTSSTDPAGATAHGRPARRVTFDDDHPFDLTEDIFHPMQLLRTRRRKWQQEMRCSRVCCIRTARKLLPSLTWLPKYQPRTDLLPDLLAGAMMAVVCVPQGMAYAVLAGLDPIIGLYSCLVPALVYAFVGCSPSMHIGPFALVSLLVATAVSSVVPDNAPVAYVQDVAFLFSILVGLVLMLMSLLRLGFAVSFLADSVLSAYTCASAVLILTSQWKSFLGLTSMPRGLSFIDSYIYIFDHLGDINVCALLLGIFSVALLLGIDHLNARMKWRVPIPSQLVAVVLGILIAYAGSMDTRYGLKVVGKIPSGLPSIRMPGTDDYTIGSSSTSGGTMINGTSTVPLLSSQPQQLTLLTFANLSSFVQPVCMLALISYIISISIAKNFATKENAANQARREKAIAAAGPAAAELPPITPIEIDANQELFALGLANFLGGFTSAYPAAGSLSRSALVYNAGVKSALFNVFSIVLLVFVLLVLTPLLYYLPSSVLAAIIFTALKGLLLQVEEGVRLYHVRKQDFIMWFCTFVATVLFDTQVGIAIGLITSLLLLLKQTSRPPITELGRLGATDLYRSVKRFPHARTFRGVLIWRFDAPLHFANKDFFREQLMRAIRRAEEREWRMTQPMNELLAEEERAIEAASSDPATRASLRARARQRIYDLSKRIDLSARKLGTTTKRALRQLAFRRARQQQSASIGVANASPSSFSPDDLRQMHERGNIDPSSSADDHERDERTISDGDESDDELHLTSTEDEERSRPPSPSRQQAFMQLDQEPTNAFNSPFQVEPIAQQHRHYEQVASSSVSSPPPPESSHVRIGSFSSPSLSPSSSSLAPSSPGSPSREYAPVDKSECRIEWLILDCSSLIDIDDAGLKMLVSLPQQLGVTLICCALKAPVRDLLRRTHFFDQRKPGASSMAGTSATGRAPKKPCIERPFLTVHRAVKYVLQQQHHLQREREEAAAHALTPSAGQQSALLAPSDAAVDTAPSVAAELRESVDLAAAVATAARAEAEAADRIV